MDENGVPFDDFRAAIEYWPRNHPLRVCLLLFAFTGCRPSEAPRFRAEDLHANWLYWKKGKNQRGWRKAHLPEWVQAEIGECRRAHRMRDGALFPYTSEEVFRREFHKVRAQLGPAWTAKRSGPASRTPWGETTFVLQIKGLRKSYASTVFYRHWQRLGDCTAAMLFASAELGHSCVEMTAHHYLKELDYIQVKKWDEFLTAEQKGVEAQSRLADYAEELTTIRFIRA